MSGLSLAAVVATAALTGATLLLLAAVAVEHSRRGRRQARDAARRAPS